MYGSETVKDSVGTCLCSIWQYSFSQIGHENCIGIFFYIPVRHDSQKWWNEKWKSVAGRFFPPFLTSWIWHDKKRRKEKLIIFQSSSWHEEKKRIKKGDEKTGGSKNRRKFLMDSYKVKYKTCFSNFRSIAKSIYSFANFDSVTNIDFLKPSRSAFILSSNFTASCLSARIRDWSWTLKLRRKCDIQIF